MDLFVHLIVVDLTRFILMICVVYFIVKLIENINQIKNHVNRILIDTTRILKHICFKKRL